MSQRAGRMTAAEAARRLDVRRDTLYAYVSRGLIRSERQEGTRQRLYHSEDVEMLRQRREGRRDPSRAAAEALHWGAPILESELTLIRDGALFFRGRSAPWLAETSTFEDVAGLLWGREPEPGIPDALPAAPPAGGPGERASALPAIERFQVVLAEAAASDVGAYDISADAVRHTGAKILRLLAAAAVGATPTRAPIAEVLQQGWAPRAPAARRTLETALILWADHELNVGTFTVRCVASAHGTPYAAVIAGLSALRGSLHGGATEQVEALFDEVADPEQARAVLEARLRRGERIPGFGHGLYPEGDPRAVALMGHVARERPRARGVAVARALTHAASGLFRRAPNVDFATVALRRSFGLPAGSALTLVAVARSAGWIAHVLEQYGTGRMIRPRARYTGPPPGSAAVPRSGRPE